MGRENACISTSSSASSSSRACGDVSYGGEPEGWQVQIKNREFTKMTLIIVEERMDGILRMTAKLLDLWEPTHDFVAFGFAFAGDSAGDAMTWIKAEKGMVNPDVRGGALIPGGNIYISKEASEPDTGTVRHRMEPCILSTGKEKWTLGQVLDIFEGHDRNYNLLSTNCWEFAFGSAVNFLRFCIGNAQDEGVKDNLKLQLSVLSKKRPILPKYLLFPLLVLSLLVEQSLVLLWPSLKWAVFTEKAKWEKAKCSVRMPTVAAARPRLPAASVERRRTTLLCLAVGAQGFPRRLS